MNTLNVYFYLSQKRLNKKGLCPIYARIVHDANTRADISTGLFIPPNEWDFKHSCAFETEKQTKERLLRIELKIRDAIRICEAKGKRHPSEVVQYLRDQDKPPVLLTVENILKEFISAKAMQGENKKKFERGINHFSKITGCKILNQIQQKELNLFLAKSTDTISTKNKKLSYLNRLLKFAIGLGYITYNPFEGFTKPKTNAKEIVQLTNVELEVLQKKDFGLPRLDQVRDLFVLQCHTGLAYCDLCQISKDLLRIKKGYYYLKGKRQKTGSEFYIPLSEKAREILDKYNYNFKIISNQKMNAYLKEIATLCRINKVLTTHVGRKTFAQKMIDWGYTGESISRMMGHAKFDMTQKHYGKIGDTRIENEVEKMSA